TQLGALTGSRQRKTLLRKQVEQLRARYMPLLEEVRKGDPGFDPDQPVAPIQLQNIRQLLPDRKSAIVQYALTAEGGYGLVITRDRIDAVELPLLTVRQTYEWSFEWYKAYQDSLAQPEK